MRIGPPATYLLIAMGTTFPLVRGLRQTFPGGHSDVFGFLWNNWWLYHAVTHHLAKPYVTTFIFAPFSLDLRLHTVGFLYGLLSIPLFPLLGQVAVLNLQVFATIVLNGYLTYLLVRHLVTDRWVAFVTGILAASVIAMNFHVYSGRPSCAAFWTAIWAILRFRRLLERPDKASSALFVVSLCTMFLADQQIAVFGVLWLILLATSSLLEQPAPILDRRVLRALIVPLLFGVLASYALYLRPLKLDVGYNMPGAAEALSYSFRLSSFLVRRQAWLVYGTIVPLGFVVVLSSLRKVPRAAPWAFGALFFFVLSLGPVLAGTTIPLPFDLLRRLPGLANLRFPYRFQMPAAFGAIVSLGVVLQARTAQVRPRRRQAIILGLAFLAVVDACLAWRSSPFVVRQMPTQAIYEEIGRDPSDGVLLEIPVGVRHGTDRIGKDGEILTFYQPIHRKRLVNGFAARAPDAALAYYRKSPALMYFANETPPAGDAESDLNGKVSELDIKYVLVHPRMLDPQRLAPTLELVARTGRFERIADGPDIIAFRRR